MDSVRAVYRWCVDFLFPQTLRAERTQAVKALPQKTRTKLFGNCAVTSLLSYSDSVVQDAIQAAKFDASVHAQTLLSSLLSDLLIEKALTESETYRTRITVVPVPLGKKRREERGYNQVEEVLLRMRAYTDGFVLVTTDLLVRTRETDKQALLGKEARERNVRGAFSCTHKDSLRGAHIVLVDDVVTTGATITEAARVLTRAGAHVTCITLARA